MRTYDNGYGFTVSFSAGDVERFMASYPGSCMVERSGYFTFSNSGDLEDHDLPCDDADGDDIMAFMHDCQTYGQSRIDALRKRKAKK